MGNLQFQIFAGGMGFVYYLELINWFYAYDGVSDLYDDLRPGKPEIKVKLKKGAKIRGFDARNVSKQLRAAFYGSTASEIIVRDESYEVNLVMAGDDRSSISNLENFYLMAGYNYQRRQEMKISSRVAMVGFSYGFGIKISRFHLSYGRATYHLAGASNHFSIATSFSSLYRDRSLY